MRITEVISCLLGMPVECRGVKFVEYFKMTSAHDLQCVKLAHLWLGTIFLIMEVIFSGEEPYAFLEGQPDISGSNIEMTDLNFLDMNENDQWDSICAM